MAEKISPEIKDDPLFKSSVINIFLRLKIIFYIKAIVSSKAEKYLRQKMIKEEKLIMEKNDKLFEIKGESIP